MDVFIYYLFIIYNINVLMSKQHSYNPFIIKIMMLHIRKLKYNFRNLFYRRIK